MSRSNHHYSSTGSPFPDEPTEMDFLKDFAATLDDLTAVRTTLRALHVDYLALEIEHRDLMDAFIAAREEAKTWEKLCYEQHSSSNNDPVQAVEVQKNGHFVKTFFGGKKVAEIWKKRGEFFCIWEEKADGSVGLSLDKIIEDLGKCREKWQRRWCEWRMRREANARSAEAAEAWREGY